MLTEENRHTQKPCPYATWTGLGARRPRCDSDHSLPTSGEVRMSDNGVHKVPADPEGGGGGPQTYRILTLFSVL